MRAIGVPRNTLAVKTDAYKGGRGFYRGAHGFTQLPTGLDDLAQIRTPNELRLNLTIRLPYLYTHARSFLRHSHGHTAIYNKEKRHENDQVHYELNRYPARYINVNFDKFVQLLVLFYLTACRTALNHFPAIRANFVYGRPIPIINLWYPRGTNVVLSSGHPIPAERAEVAVAVVRPHIIDAGRIAAIYGYRWYIKQRTRLFQTVILRVVNRNNGIHLFCHAVLSFFLLDINLQVHSNSGHAHQNSCTQRTTGRIKLSDLGASAPDFIFSAPSTLITSLFPPVAHWLHRATAGLSVLPAPATPLDAQRLLLTLSHYTPP